MEFLILFITFPSIFISLRFYQENKKLKSEIETLKEDQSLLESEELIQQIEECGELLDAFAKSYSQLEAKSEEKTVRYLNAITQSLENTIKNFQ